MENKDKKTCYGCAYKGECPGSVHSRCKFDWNNSDLKPPKGDPHGIKTGWYNFPLNYDPVWQETECQAHATKADG